MNLVVDQDVNRRMDRIPPVFAKLLHLLVLVLVFVLVNDRNQTGGSKSVVEIHDLKPLKCAAYFIGRKAAAEAAGTRLPQTVLKYRICRKNCSFYCFTCSHNTTKTSGIVALCGLSTGRECFKKQKHHKTPGDSSETDWEDLI